jgi:hypothetical protein
MLNLGTVPYMLQFTSVGKVWSLSSLVFTFPTLAGTLYYSQQHFLSSAIMAHRHNRRRARRPRLQASPTQKGLSSRHSLDQFIISKAGIISEACAPNLTLTGSATLPGLPTTDATIRRRSDIPAMLWQNRYAAWQEQDRVQREQAAKFEAQQIQLFGGEPGDDVELCYKMLEYFGGLDYIT